MDIKNTPWRKPPERLSLKPHAVDLWRLKLPLSAEELALCRSYLTSKEQEQADRFYFERDRVRFLAARGILRRILTVYLGGSPKGLKFEYSHYGKPSLPDASNPEQLEFNYSHSHELVVYAFTLKHPIGVDVEYHRERVSFEEIIQRNFSEQERQAWQSVPVAQRKEAFFHGWTRKEAFIKAVGQGLSYPLDQFSITLRPQEPARLLEIKGDQDAAKRWTFEAFSTETGYSAAFATEQKVDRVVFYGYRGKK